MNKVIFIAIFTLILIQNSKSFVNANTEPSRDLVKESNTLDSDIKQHDNKNHFISPSKDEKTATKTKLEKRIIEKSSISIKDYYVSSEKNINNRNFNKNHYFRRKPYNYDEEPSKSLIEDISKSNNNAHLPKFMLKEELSKLLFVAVNNEDIGSIKSLLEKGANINAQDKNNKYTPLMYTVQNNKINSLRYLLIKGADPNIKATNKMSSLHLATILQRFQILYILLNSNVDIFAKDKNNKTFYDYIPTNHLNTAVINIYNTRKNSNDALLDFCILGSLKGVKYSLQNKADINVRNSNGDTPLILAVKHNYIEIVSYLLSIGADQFMKNKDNIDATAIAKSNGNDEIYKVIESVKFNKTLNDLGLVDQITHSK